MQRVRLAFSDQLRDFDPRNNFWFDQWRSFADVEVVDDLKDAQVLMYSDWGQAHWTFEGLKIYTTGENMWPDFEECDLAFTSMHMPDEPRNVRLPVYVFYTSEPDVLVKGPDHDPLKILREKTRFCNFLVSNPRSPMRNRMFKLLNARKRVDSGGKHFNNLGYRVADKLAFVRQYKFTLAFENSSTPGYTTEKLLEPMSVNSLPIYWGNPELLRDFNPESVIVAERFASLEALVDHVLEVDSDDELYLNYLRQPWFPDNRVTAYFSHDRVRAALESFWRERPERPRPRRYKKRHLREHTYDTGLARSWMSFACRAESAVWRLRHGKPDRLPPPTP